MPLDYLRCDWLCQRARPENSYARGRTARGSFRLRGGIGRTPAALLGRRIAGPSFHCCACHSRHAESDCFAGEDRAVFAPVQPLKGIWATAWSRRMNIKKHGCRLSGTDGHAQIDLLGDARDRISPAPGLSARCSAWKQIRPPTCSASDSARYLFDCATISGAQASLPGGTLPPASLPISSRLISTIHRSPEHRRMSY